MWQNAAEFHTKHGNPSVAAESLEEVLKSNPKDKRTVAKLIMAYAQVRFYFNLELRTKSL